MQTILSYPRAAAGTLAALLCAGMTSAVHADPTTPHTVRAKMTKSHWREYTVRTLADLKGFTPPASPVPVDKYGGWTGGPRQETTGFFHTKKIGDRWWLIDPDGYLFLYKGVVSVSPGQDNPAFTAKFGSEEGWAKATTDLLTTNGFNGTGAWSADTVLAKAPTRVAYAPIWNFMSRFGKQHGGTFSQPGHTGYPHDAIFVFDPGFAPFCDNFAKMLTATKDDPYLIGYFSDNELPFPRDLLDKFLGLPVTDPGGKAVREWLGKRRNTTITDTAAIIPTLTTDEREDWRGYVVDRYLDIVSHAIHKYDPNHLYLGPRLHGATLSSKAVFQAAGKYLDVIAVNVYGVWDPKKNVENWNAWSGKPVVISEWYAKGEDSGMPNKTGAGWTVPTQQDRAAFYQHFTLQLLESKGCVGWHWFKYIDNIPNEKGSDPSNQDSNKGIVNAHFEPWTVLLAGMKPLNDSAYPLTSYFDRGATHTASAAK